MSGYHIREIESGTLGKFSKIKEEFEELEDAHVQGNKILILCELSDLLGAIDFYVENNFQGITVADIRQFSELTKQAFKDGTRS